MTRSRISHVVLIALSCISSLLGRGYADDQSNSFPDGIPSSCQAIQVEARLRVKEREGVRRIGLLIAISTELGSSVLRNPFGLDPEGCPYEVAIYNSSFEKIGVILQQRALNWRATDRSSVLMSNGGVFGKCVWLQDGDLSGGRVDDGDVSLFQSVSRRPGKYYLRVLVHQDLFGAIPNVRRSLIASGSGFVLSSQPIPVAFDKSGRLASPVLREFQSVDVVRVSETTVSIGIVNETDRVFHAPFSLMESRNVAPLTVLRKDNDSDEFHALQMLGSGKGVEVIPEPFVFVPANGIVGGAIYVKKKSLNNGFCPHRITINEAVLQDYCFDRMGRRLVPKSSPPKELFRSGIFD